MDQDAFTSDEFWSLVDAHIPGWRKEKKYKRFAKFCENLMTKKPGVDLLLPSGQSLLEQYMYPGLDEGGALSVSSKTPPRAPYPEEDFSELRRLKIALETKVAPVAMAELDLLLDAAPTISDDAEAADEGDTWHRAAWYGWQFLSLRGASKMMPKTTKALVGAFSPKGLGPAHRFVGVARQKANCRGMLHSDGRNYMISTLTPLKALPGKCGITVNGIDRELATGGEAVILDNTFMHEVWNDSNEDRFCLISECWHPALTVHEREALATLFAVKDRFTVSVLKLAPWGYSDEALGAALQNGAVNELAFWRNIDHAQLATTGGGGGGGGGGDHLPNEQALSYEEKLVMAADGASGRSSSRSSSGGKKKKKQQQQSSRDKDTSGGGGGGGGGAIAGRGKKRRIKSRLPSSGGFSSAGKGVKV